jgi:hypothetical protein
MKGQMPHKTNEILIRRGDTTAIGQMPYAVIGEEKFRNDTKITWARYLSNNEANKWLDRHEK